MRKSNLIGEIENESVRSNPDLPMLLRKCIALGGQSGSAALREWATQELKGYRGDDELPDYRIVPAVLVIDGATMTHRVRGQQISPAVLPEIARDRVKEEVRLNGPIAELVDAVQAARASGDDFVNFGIPGGSILTLLTNDELQSKGVTYQNIERIYLRAAVTSLVGTIDAVHTNLVELMAELRAGLGHGEAIPDKNLADRAVSVVIHGDKNRVSIAQATSGSHGTAKVEGTAAKESRHRSRHVLGGWNSHSIGGCHSVSRLAPLVANTALPDISPGQGVGPWVRQGDMAKIELNESWYVIRMHVPRSP